MKASESSERYVGKVRECCNYAVRSAKSFADSEVNASRQAGGEGEESLRASLQDDLTKFADEVDETPFLLKPGSSNAAAKWTAIFMLIAAVFGILAVLIPAAGTVLADIGLICSVLTLLCFFGLLGGTAKSRKSADVLARRRPKGKTEHRIILQANLDAPFARRFSAGAVSAFRVLTILGIVLYLAFDVLASLNASGTLCMPAWFAYIAYPLVVFILFPFLQSRAVLTDQSWPGVSDNLSGCYTASGAMRYLSVEKLRLENTEVDVLLTSGKSSHMEGAKQFLRTYSDALKETDTAIICLDSLFSVDSLNTLARGRQLNRAIAAAAENADVMLTDHAPKYHVSEAETFRKGGVPTILLSSLTDGKPDFYRGPDDSTEHLDVRAVEAAMKLALELAYLKDDPESKF